MKGKLLRQVNQENRLVFENKFEEKDLEFRIRN